MTANELLNEVLKIIERYKGNSKLLDYLLKHEMLHSSFERRYMMNVVDFSFVVTNAILKDNDWVDFYLTAADGTPYKAEVIFDGKWYLKSFLFECQGCFGDDKDCGVCGGSGLGVL